MPRYILAMTTVTPPPPPVTSTARGRFSPRVFLLVILLLGAAFLGGYVPETLRARRLEAALMKAELNTHLYELHRRAGVAAAEAQRNNYANATAAAREFFEGCANLSNTEVFAGQPRTRIALAGYAAQRDEIMTMLANADPAVKDRLTGIFLAMDGVLARRE